ncbi:sugar phosphate isomerase/epimerase [Candidatus Sumerlaeota bacterium]|nr:sugar phosphate isomerase/epimerase [Candidatus Sumerlaeota bacterium]
MTRQRFTRKEFMKFSASAAAGLVVGSCAAPRAQDGDPDYYAGLNVGMHTYTLRNFGLKDAIRITRDLKLRNIGLNPKHLALDSDEDKIKEAREMIADAGLTLRAVGVVGFGKKDPEPRKIFEFAKMAGFKTISTSAQRETLETLDPLVKEYGIKIAIHNHGPKDYWSTPEKVLDAVKDLHPGVGACVDCGHYKRAGVEPHEAIRLLGARVHDVHLKDVDKAEDAGKSVVMGRGVVDVKELLKALLEIKFDAHAAIEYEADADDPAPGVEKSLEHIRECLQSLR